MTKSAGTAIYAKRWFIRGRVRGVGRLTGYTRNLDDGRVAVYAVGKRWGEFHGIEGQEAAIQEYGTFRIA
jgi:hypothetical protein